MRLETFALVFEATGAKELGAVLKSLNKQLDNLQKTRTAHVNTVNKTVNKTVNNVVNRHKIIESLERKYNEKVKKSYEEKNRIQNQYDTKVRYNEKVNIDRKIKESNILSKLNKDRLREGKEQLELDKQRLGVHEKEFRRLLGIRALGMVGAVAAGMGVGAAIISSASSLSQGKSQEAASNVATATLTKMSPQSLLALQTMFKSFGSGADDANKLIQNMLGVYSDLIFKRDSAIMGIAGKLGYSPTKEMLDRGDPLEMIKSLIGFFGRKYKEQPDKHQVITQSMMDMGFPKEVAAQVMSGNLNEETLDNLLKRFSRFQSSDLVMRNLAEMNKNWAILDATIGKLGNSFANLYNTLSEDSIKSLSDGISSFADAIAEATPKIKETWDSFWDSLYKEWIEPAVNTTPPKNAQPISWDEWKQHKKEELKEISPYLLAGVNPIASLLAAYIGNRVDPIPELGENETINNNITINVNKVEDAITLHDEFTSRGYSYTSNLASSNIAGNL